MDADFRRVEIIKRCLAGGMPGMVGGGMKTLKTTLMMDAAIALASGTPFLGHFDVPNKMRVGFMSGESGGWALQETARRQFQQRGIGMKSENFWISEDLPKMLVDDDIRSLENLVVDEGTEVLMLDPLYLMVRGADSTSINAMGEPLRNIGDMCRANNITLMMCHHGTKASIKVGDAMELHNLTGAGVGEWTRQAWLLSRREAFIDGSGHHDLWFRIASGPISALYAVTIDEGEYVRENLLRDWKVKVQPASEIAAEETAFKEEVTKTTKTAAVVKALTGTDGLNTTRINEKIDGVKINGTFLDDLVGDGVIVYTKILITDKNDRAYHRKGYKVAP